MTCPALRLTIRFAPPTPDLSLTISSPSTTTPHNLHTLIRPHLPLHQAACPIRLISAGALLPPNLPLTSSLRLPQQRKRALPPPPPRCPAAAAAAAAKEEKEKDDQVEPIYIHAAISSSSKLSAAALAAEYQTLPPHGSSSRVGFSHPPKIPSQTSPSSNPPLGFDALLSTGISPAEITSLRSQFRSMQAHIHTPDTMPSHSELLILEERWLDQNSASGGEVVGDVEGGASGWAGGGGGDGGALEDVLWGSVMGFFWAVGAVAWLVREEGVWSRRRSAAVIVGVTINLAVCALRGLG